MNNYIYFAESNTGSVAQPHGHKKDKIPIENTVRQCASA